MPFYLIWNQNTQLLKGYDGTDWVEGQLTFPISFPGTTTDPQFLTLRSAAAVNHTFETLTNVGFYLVGADALTVQTQWPHIGDSYSPARPDLDGGFEISFDNGNTWTRFTDTVGSRSNPATWIGLPQEAVGYSGVAGQLGPYDMASFAVRYVIPPNVSISKVLDVQLAAGFEIC